MRAILRHPLPWILLLAAAIRGSAVGYLRGSDDLVYARGALALLRGDYAPGDSFHQMRLGVVLPAAASFRLFGVGAWPAALWAFLTSLGTVALLFAVLDRTRGRTVAVVASLFLAVATQHVLSSAELFPDAPMTFWLLLSGGLYAWARAGGGPGWAYAASGACFAVACSTRIEALKMLPALAVVEAWTCRRRGLDRRSLLAVGAAASGLLAEAFLLAAATGDPLTRVREIGAVARWSGGSAARDLGLGVMVKSLFSPAGAFGLLFPFALAGIAAARRAVVPLFLAAWLLAAALAMAALYRIADGRHYCVLAPAVAWLAAEAVGALSRPRARLLAAAALTLSCAVLVHVRLPSDTARAFAGVRAALEGSSVPAYSDPRTAGLLNVYAPELRVSDYARVEPKAPCVVIEHPELRQIERAMYGRDAFPALPMSVERELPVRALGLPGLREAAGLLRRRKGMGASTIRILRSSE